MAIAGRVAIVPKGEYSNAVTYDKLDLVMFNNDAYIAKKASTGIEPTNDEYWMLILNNVVAEDLENIINGTTPVGKANDADTVDGYHASRFIHNLVVSSENKTDDPNTTEKSRIRTAHANCPTANVEYIIDTTFTDSTANNYERRQTAYGTGGNNVVYNRAKAYGGAWSAWKKVANADEVLPLDGSVPMSGVNLWTCGGYGRIYNDSNMSILLANNVAKDTSNARGLLIANSNYVADIAKALVFRDEVNGALTDYTILHTGNKPIGSYTGNGDATRREIATGGIGDICIVYSSYGTRIITRIGCENPSGGMLSDESAFYNGTIVLASTNNALNASGVTYTYQVL